MPPDYSELPLPKKKAQDSEKKSEEFDIQKLISKNSTNKGKKEVDENLSQSVEEFILKKINDN